MRAAAKARSTFFQLARQSHPLGRSQHASPVLQGPLQNISPKRHNNMYDLVAFPGVAKKRARPNAPEPMACKSQKSKHARTAPRGALSGVREDFTKSCSFRFLAPCAKNCRAIMHGDPTLASGNVTVLCQEVSYSRWTIPVHVNKFSEV